MSKPVTEKALPIPAFCLIVRLDEMDCAPRSIEFLPILHPRMTGQDLYVFLNTFAVPCSWW